VTPRHVFFSVQGTVDLPLTTPACNIRDVIEVPVFVITLMLSIGTAVNISKCCPMLLPDLNIRKAKERMALAEKLIGIEFR
jgi:hypothetical protein